MLYLIEHQILHQILLPGLSVLSRLVRQARREENARLHTHLAGRIPTTVHADLLDLLRVHDDSRSPGRVEALDRTSLIAGIGAEKVEVDDVPQAKLEALARYRLRAKTPSLADLTPDRQAATLLATVRHLETASVDDALDVLEALRTAAVMARSRKHYKATDIAAHAELTAGSWKRPIFANPELELAVHRRRRHPTALRGVRRHRGDVRPPVAARVRPHQLPGLLHLPHAPGTETLRPLRDPTQGG